MLNNDRCVRSLLIQENNNKPMINPPANILTCRSDELALHQFLNGKDNIAVPKIICACK